MKIISKKVLLIILYVFTISSACSAKEFQLQVFENVDTKVNFKPWNTKGLGDEVDRVKLTILKTDNAKSNITILRWNKSHSNYVSEFYEYEDSDIYSTNWRLKNQKVTKTLTLQHNSFYMIQEKKPGKEGGVKTEIFKISTESLNNPK